VGGDAVHYFDPRSPVDFKAALEKALSEGRTPEAVTKRLQQASEFSWEKTTREFCQAARDVAGM